MLFNMYHCSMDYIIQYLIITTYFHNNYYIIILA